MSKSLAASIDNKFDPCDIIGTRASRARTCIIHVY
jgi:hypothetical protein